jgi:hypothetical protein
MAGKIIRFPSNARRHTASDVYSRAHPGRSGRRISARLAYRNREDASERRAA